jgi:glycosyltransferase involved in cell wall biosynthesis
VIKHIYPKGQVNNGISVYGHQMDALLGSYSTDKNIWHFELGYTGVSELWEAYRISKTNGSRYVVTLHDPPVICGKIFSKYIQSNRLILKIIRKLLDVTLGRLIVKRVIKRASRVIVLNPLAIPGIERRFNIPVNHIVTLPLMPSIPTKRSSVYFTSNHLNLLFFGVITPRKGLSDLIESMNILASSANPPGLSLTVIGSPGKGDEQYYSKLIETVERLNLENNVRFLGASDNATLSEELQRCDAVILPYHESNITHASGPLTTSLGFGKPVIASDINIFNGEKLHAKEHIFLTFKTGEASDLAIKIHYLNENRPEMVAMGSRASEHIAGFHNNECVREQIVEIYNNL